MEQSVFLMNNVLSRNIVDLIEQCIIRKLTGYLSFEKEKERSRIETLGHLGHNAGTKVRCGRFST